MADPVIHYTFDTDGTNSGTLGPYSSNNCTIPLQSDIESYSDLSTIDTTNKLVGTASIAVGRRAKNADSFPRFIFNTGPENAWTISFWARMNSSNNAASIEIYSALKASSNQASASYNERDSMGYEGISFYRNSSGNWQGENVAGIRDDNWHHFVVTKNKIYYDNTLKLSNSTEGNFSTNEDVNFILGTAYWKDTGASDPDYEGGISGNFDNVRVYDYTLSDAQIHSLFLEGVILNESIIHYTFDTDGTNSGSLGSSLDITTIPSDITFDSSNKLIGDKCISIFSAVASDYNPSNSAADSNRMIIPTWTTPNNFTISQWMKMETYVGQGQAVMQWEVNDGVFALCFWSSATTLLVYYNAVNTVTIPNVFDNEYHHFLFTITATDVTTYVDNVDCGSISYSGLNNQSVTKTYIGSRANTDPVTSGYIDDFRVYDYAADTTTIDIIYKLGKNTNVASLSGVSMSSLQNAGATISQLITAGISLADLLDGGVSVQTLLNEGISQLDITNVLTQIKIHSDFTISDGTNDSIFIAEIISPNNPLNTPNVFASTDAKTTTPEKWQDIQISSTGQYQIAVVGGYSLSTSHSLAAVTGNVWISTDYGETWLEKTGIDQVSGAEQSWINACVSADGSIMMVKAMGNIVYRSENGGASWTQKTITNFTEKVSNGWDGRPYYNLLMASDGEQLIIGTYNNIQTKMIISTDGGDNWADLTSLSSGYEYIIDYSMSKSGKYILVMFNNSTRPKYSDDFGATFISITDTNLSLSAETNSNMLLFSRGVCAISDNGYAIFTDYNDQINTINLTTGTVSNNAYDGAWVTNTSSGFPWAVCISQNGQYMIIHIRQNNTYVNTMYISSDYGTTFTAADSNEFYVGYKAVTFNSSAIHSRCFATRFSDDNKYIAAIQEGDYIYVRKNTFIPSEAYTPSTFAAKLNTDLGYAVNTITVGIDSTTTDSTPYYRIYLQFANAVTLTNMPKYIFHIPFSDLSVKAGGQVNFRSVNLDADMTITTSYDTTSNTSTIPAGNIFINNFVSTIETDLVNFTLSYDASINAITFDGLAQDISMSITSNDTTIFDTSITEITTTAHTLPFLTYGQPEPTISQYIDNGITISTYISNGYTIPQLYKEGFIPDWSIVTDANHFAQSYIKDFIDISGSLLLRENSNLTVNGNIETKGNITIKNQIMAADLTLNHNMLVGGDISMNGNVTVGDISMNGKVVDCSFTDSSIPEGAFNGSIPAPDYTQPTILYEKGFDTTADVSMNANVQINNLKVDGNIEFSDGTTMNTYDDNKSYDYDLSLQPGDYFDLTSGSLNLYFAPGDKGEQIFCSSDGRYAAIGVGGGWNSQNSGDGDVNRNGIFITRDFGATWNQTHLPNPADGTPLARNHIAFNMSYDGKYMVCGVHASGTGATGTDTVIGLSTDYGVTWTTYDTNTKLGGTSAHWISAIAVNHDASIITVCRSTDNNTQISTDQMATWSNVGMVKEGEFQNTTKIVNNRILVGHHNVSLYMGYAVDGTSIGNFNAAGASAYRCIGGFPMGGPGSSNTLFFGNSNNGNIRKYTNVDTTPVAVDMSTVNTDAENYNNLGIIMSPLGKYVLIGQNSGTIRPTLRTEDKIYVSNDFGETFSTVSPYLFNVGWFKSIAISDNGYFYGFDPTGKKLYHSRFEKFKASTFTSLNISGDLTAGSFSTSSDYRIKTDISQLDENVTLDNLRPVKYLQTLINKPQYGLIAHELQEYYPDLVVGEKDGKEWQQVNYTGLIALLINEIKQLKRELTELENGM
jgi:hypothetical protein